MSKISRATGKTRPRRFSARFARVHAAFPLKRDPRSGRVGNPPVAAIAVPSIDDRARLSSIPVVDYSLEEASYARLKPGLLDSAPGRFVVFKGDEMLGPFDDFKQAHDAGRRRFGLVAIYVKQVLAEEPRDEVGTVETCQY